MKLHQPSLQECKMVVMVIVVMVVVMVMMVMVSGR